MPCFSGFACIIFVPVFLKYRITTITQFIKLKLGRKIALCYSIVSICLFSTITLGAALFWGAYAADIVFRDILSFISDNQIQRISILIILLGFFSAIYTYLGGLGAVDVLPDSQDPEGPRRDLRERGAGHEQCRADRRVRRHHLPGLQRRGRGRTVEDRAGEPSPLPDLKGTSPHLSSSQLISPPSRTDLAALWPVISAVTSPLSPPPILASVPLNFL